MFSNVLENPANKASESEAQLTSRQSVVRLRNPLLFIYLFMLGKSVFESLL
jgi:hypothetical protein